MNTARRELPVGHVPEYKDFVRHVWSYEDPEIGRAIGEPPFVFEAIFSPADEGEILVNYTRSTYRFINMDESRMDVAEWEDEDGRCLLVRFRDLEALYTFICCVAMQADTNRALQATGRMLMWTLGFRWI